MATKSYIPVDPFDDSRVPEADFERLVMAPRVIESAGRRDDFWGAVLLLGALVLGTVVGALATLLALRW